MTTVIFEDEAVALDADVAGDSLWVRSPELARTLGWELKPEGLCRGPLCMPIAATERADLLRADGGIDLVALARRRGQAVVHDDARSTWVFGPPGTQRSETVRSLVAPDFALPDLDGRLHRLSDARGRKVLLASWASW